MKESECVARGAAWLDERYPGWEERVTVDTLCLRDAWQCICGQLFDEEARIQDEVNGYAFARKHLFAGPIDGRFR